GVPEDVDAEVGDEVTGARLLGIEEGHGVARARPTLQPQEVRHGFLPIRTGLVRFVFCTDCVKIYEVRLSINLNVRRNRGRGVTKDVSRLEERPASPADRPRRRSALRQDGDAEVPPSQPPQPAGLRAAGVAL